MEKSFRNTYGPGQLFQAKRICKFRSGFAQRTTRRPTSGPPLTWQPAALRGQDCQKILGRIIAVQPHRNYRLLFPRPDRLRRSIGPLIIDVNDLTRLRPGH